MLRIIMLIVIIPSVVILNVIMVGVVASFQQLDFIPGANIINFYGRKIRIFVISQSVCPWQAFLA
jgi:hypothetical protein